MDRNENVVERALSSIARSREMRARNMQRRMEFQKRAEAVTAKPLYILRKYGGQQLSFELDAPHPATKSH